MDQLKADITNWEEHCELKARRGGRTRDSLNSASKLNRIFRENIREVRAQYDQDLVNPWYECDGFQSQLATYDSGSEASCKSLHVAHGRFGAYRKASDSSHMRLESDFPSGLAEFSMEVAVFVNETVALIVLAFLIGSRQHRMLWSYSLLQFLRCSVTLKLVVLYRVPIPNLRLVHLILRRSHLFFP